MKKLLAFFAPLALLFAALTIQLPGVAQASPSAYQPVPNLTTLAAYGSVSPTILHAVVQDVTIGGSTGAAYYDYTSAACSTADGLTQITAGSGCWVINTAVAKTFSATVAFQTLFNAAFTVSGDSTSVNVGCVADPTSCGWNYLMAADLHADQTNHSDAGRFVADMSNLGVFPYSNPDNDYQQPWIMPIGINDANTVGAGSYEVTYKNILQAAASWTAIGSDDKVFAQTCSTTGTWVDDTTYITGIASKSTTNGSTMTCSLTTYAGPLYAYYRCIDGNGGTFTYALDGGSPVSVNTGPTINVAMGNPAQAVCYVRLSVSAGSHSIVFAVTSATSGSNIVSILGIARVPDASKNYYRAPLVVIGGVLKQQSDAKSADTAAYNNDNYQSAVLLAGDGLNVIFFNVRNWVNDTTDMQPTVPDGGVHPINIGYYHYKQGMEALLNFVPNQTYTDCLVIGSGTCGSNTLEVLGASTFSTGKFHPGPTDINMQIGSVSIFGTTMAGDQCYNDAVMAFTPCGHIGSEHDFAGGDMNVVQNDGVIALNQLWTYGADNYFVGKRSAGTSASKTAVQSGDVLSGLVSQPYDGSAYSSQYTSSIGGVALENFDSSHHGTALVGNCTAVTTITLIECFRSTSTGFSIPSGFTYQINGTQISASNLSNGVSGSGAVALVSGPTFTGTTTFPGTTSIDSSGHVGINGPVLGQFSVHYATDKNFSFSTYSGEVALQSFNDAVNAYIPMNFVASEFNLILSGGSKITMVGIPSAAPGGSCQLWNNSGVLNVTAGC